MNRRRWQGRIIIGPRISFGKILFIFRDTLVDFVFHLTPGTTTDIMIVFAALCIREDETFRLPAIESQSTHISVRDGNRIMEPRMFRIGSCNFDAVCSSHWFQSSIRRNMKKRLALPCLALLYLAFIALHCFA